MIFQLGSGDGGEVQVGSAHEISLKSIRVLPLSPLLSPPHHACTGSTHHYPSQPTISSHLISSHHMADAEKTDKSAVGTESNVTEDGGIVKKILKEGEGWQSPGKGADVTGMS